MRKYIFINTIIILTSINAFGQKDWENKFNGLVITEDYSVIKGYLKFSVGTRDLGTMIKLYKAPNDKPQIFYTLQLKGYVYKKDTFKIIHNLQPFLDNSKIIESAEALIVQKGKLTLFKIPEEYYTTDPFGPNPYSSVTVYKMVRFIYVISDIRGEMIGVKKENFVSVMNELLVDSKDLLEKVNDKTYKFKDLEKTIKEYNQKFP